MASGSSVSALEAQLRGLADATTKLADDARNIAQSEHQQALADLKAAESGKQKTLGVDAAVAEATGRIAPTARRLAGQLAPGIASMSPDDAGWHSREFVGAGVTPYARLGTLPVSSPSEPVPVLAPLLGTNGWQVLTDTPAAAHRLIQAAALRLVASAEPFRLRIDAFDPKLTGAMGLLGQITTKFPQIVPRAMHTGSQLHDVLTSLVEESSSRAGRMAQLGQQRFEQLIEGGEANDPYRVVVLFDYPSGIDWAAQHELVRLAATAADRGICFLVHADQSIAPARDVNPAELVAHLARVEVMGARATTSHFPSVDIKLDPPLAASTTASVCDTVIQLADGAVLPTVEFMSTLPNEDDWWQPVDDELSTIVGYDGRTPATLRLRPGNPALPHMLIGGAAGQGKSNLLLVMIHGLAARYAPRDLEMVLLDFKHGVEFASLGPGRDRPYWLPHVKVLGVHSDRAFGIAVLRHLSDEIARRSTYFKEKGNVASISHLADDPNRPPRIVVILDEFQVLLEEDDEVADEAVRLIERLMRLGRAYGVHMVLATQTIEGVSRMSLRRDAIFGQVPYRIALKSTQSDSQGILRQGNTAAADLQFRGEAILNANFGSPDDNQRILVSYAPPDTLADLRRNLHGRARAGGPVEPPRVFHLGEPATLAEALAKHPPTPGAVIEAWAGLPVAVADTPGVVQVRQDPGSGVIVLGDGPLEAIGVLTGLAVSSAAGGSGQRPRFIILDGAAADRSTSEAKASLVQTLIGIGCEIELVDQPDRVTAKLGELAEQVEGGRSVGATTYVLGIGMHLIPRMAAESAAGDRPADSLRRLVSEGPGVGLVTFAWWNRIHVVEAQLGWERANISAYVFLRHPQDGVRSVCGPMVNWAAEPQRALLWDGISPEPTVVVPFAPLMQSDVDSVVQAALR